MSQNWKQLFKTKSFILQTLSSFKIRTILFIFHSCVMLLILLSIGILYILTSLQLSNLLEKIVENSFYMESVKEMDAKQQMLKCFWITFITSMSKPIISMHKLYNFYDQLSSLTVNLTNHKNQNYIFQDSQQIEQPYICLRNWQNPLLYSNDQIKLQSLLQFPSLFSIKNFGVQHNLGFFNLQQPYLVDYPCFNLINNTTYNPESRPWYIEAQKAYNLQNFQNYDVRLTDHYLTIPFNDYRFSIALPMINLQKKMIGAWRIHIKSQELQNQIKISQADTNTFVTTNSGMLLLCTNGCSFNLGTDYFQNQSITGFESDDWLAITQYNQSNCPTFGNNIICRINVINLQEYFFVLTSLDNYNIQILVSVSKTKYLQFINHQQQLSSKQIFNILLLGTLILILVSFTNLIISTLLLKKIVNPIYQIAKIFRVGKHSSSQNILQRFENFKLTQHYYDMFIQPSRLMSLDIHKFCKTIHLFMSNFTFKNKKNNKICEFIQQLQFPKTELKMQNYKQYIDQVQNISTLRSKINVKIILRQLRTKFH